MANHDHAGHEHVGHGEVAGRGAAGHEHGALQHVGHEHAGHGDVAGAGHEHAASGGAVSWGMAASATLHCLTGCAIGEVLGVVIGTALGWSSLATIVLAIALAFVFGYALTMRGVLRSGVGVRAALGIALAADSISIAVLELVDNTALLVIPGAMDASIDSPLFWGSLAAALALAFVVTVPVNRWLIGRGRGHALVHSMHH